MQRNIRFHKLTGPSVLGLVAAFSVALPLAAKAQMVGAERAYLNRLEIGFPATTVAGEAPRSIQGELALLGRTAAPYSGTDPVIGSAPAAVGTHRIGGAQALLGTREQRTEE